MSSTCGSRSGGRESRVATLSSSATPPISSPDFSTRRTQSGSCGISRNGWRSLAWSPSGEDATDRVWALRGVRSTEARTRKTGTFTFLGFTHYCGGNSNGNFVVWRRTAAKRLRAKLLSIKQELRRKTHEPIVLVGAWLKRVMEEYFRYHAVPGNLAVLGRFRERLCRYRGAHLASS